jgi:hypothetical protein
LLLKTIKSTPFFKSLPCAMLCIFDLFLFGGKKIEIVSNVAFEAYDLCDFLLVDTIVPFHEP